MKRAWLVLGVFLMACGTVSNMTDGGGDDGGEGDAMLVVAPDSVDLGTVPVGSTSAPRDLTVTNMGTAESGTLSTAIAGDGFAIDTDGCAGTTLAAGGSCTITVEFSPTATGDAAGSVTASASPGGSAQATLSGTGIAATLTITPNPQDFGIVTVASSVSAAFTVTNGGSAASGNLTPSITGADAAAFTLSGDGCAGTDLAPAASCMLTITFSPGEARAFSGALSVVGASGGGGYANLSGTGQTPASLSLDPTSHDFGIADVGSLGPTFSFDVSNAGGAPSGTLTTTLTGDYTIVADACAGGALAGGGRCSITIQFQPATWGTRAGTLQVAEAGGASLTADLTGVGRDFVILTVTPVGNGDGTVTGGAIACGGTCTASYERSTSTSVVTLSAAPDPVTSNFGGWGGDCAGAGGCTVTMDQNRTVTAAFPLKQFRLTVTGRVFGGGTGSVTAPGLTCSNACTQTALYDYGTVVSPTAAGTGGSLYYWSQDCTGTTGCSVTMTADHAVTATFNASNYVFATADPHNGNWGGLLTNADAFCNTQAAAHGIPGTYVAWISNAATNAGTRLGSARGWIRLDGLPFADTVASLTGSRKIFYPVWYDASFTKVADGNFAGTGTLDDGSSSPSNCSGWMDGSSGPSIIGGAVSGGSGTWTNGTGAGCDSAARWYCFGTNFNRAVSPQPAIGRTAFMSAGAFAQTGLSNADLICRNEAQAAGHASFASFKALIAPTGATAASRFNLTGAPWFRPDGVQVVLNAADLATGALWAPIATNANGTIYNSYTTRTWGGAATTTTAGAATTNCNNWATTSGTTCVGIAGWTRTPGYFCWNTTWGCSTANVRLYCLQD